MILGRYVRWLHTGWPAGTVEKLPESGDGGVTAVPGLRIVGDLTGIPLLKFSADSGARAVMAIAAEPDFRARKGKEPDVLDLAIIGGGVSGIAAAMMAKKQGLHFAVYEAAVPFTTIVDFPRHKPIYTYPTAMKPAGEMHLGADVKEALVDELEAQRRAAGIEPLKASVERIERKGSELIVHFAAPEPQAVRALRVIVAIGRGGNYRPLNVPGETLDKVCQRLFDPADHAGKQALVVGGGDSAVETTIALARAGAHVTLSYRNKEFSRPKAESLAALAALQAQPDGPQLMLGSRLKEIRPSTVIVTDNTGSDVTIENDVVFSMIGREAPLDFFRRSGVPIRGEWRPWTWATFALFFAFCIFLFNWKADGALNHVFRERHWFPYGLPETLGTSALARATAVSLRQPGFYYSLAYCACVVLFGSRRIRRRNTPYITRQTLTLMAIQLIPLFLIPYFILPWAGYAGAFDGGIGKTIADHLFPSGNDDYGREYWRAFGLILAWPLFIWNFFTAQPNTWWLAIGLIQTFVVIPVIVYRWGKGAYCGWICSCGALAETLGDTQRHKMPHGPIWNRLNLVGQGVLAVALLLFAARVVSWYSPDSAIGQPLQRFYDTLLSNNTAFGIPLDYSHVVDTFLGGVVGVGCYFWFSGRVWCRFACPLAALMHIYARFSRFRIFAEKKRCISCNICTSVCHQGIDVMNFANKGRPMEDPECVRCSACVQSCPTGTLAFGRYGKSGEVILDNLSASPVLAREGGKLHLNVVGSP